MPRIADCGVEDDRAANSEPETPWLEMVKLPPETSRPLSLPARAPPSQLVELGGDFLRGSANRVLDHRDDQPLFAERGADPDVDRRRNLEPILSQRPLIAGATVIASAAALTM